MIQKVAPAVHASGEPFTLSSAAVRRTALAAALQLWLFTFVALAGTTLLFPYPALSAAALVFYVVPLLGWVITRMRILPDRLDIAILVALAAHLVVSFLGLDPLASLQSSGAALAFVATFWMAGHIGADRDLRRVSAIAIALALTFWSAVIAVTWIAEKWIDITVLGWPPRLDAYQAYAWGSINTPPVLILLAVPFVGFMPRGRLRSATAAVLIASAIIIVPFSVGRAAWLAIAVSVLAFELVSGAPATRWLYRRGLPGRAALAAGAMAMAACVALVASRGTNLVDDLLTRLRLWEQAAGIIAADPLTGAGPGTYSWARLQHAPDYVDRVGVTLAHNVVIQTLADGGLILAAAFGAVMVAWFSKVAVARPLAVGQRLCVAVLAGYAAFTILDDLSFIPAVTVVLLFIAAWALPPRDALVQRRTTSFRTSVPAIAVIAGLVLAAPASASLAALRMDLNDARGAALDGDYQAAVIGFRRAAEQQPSVALHWLSVGLVEHQLGNTSAARAAYQRAQLANPGDPRPWGALAALTSDSHERITLLEEAARRANDPQYAFRLGDELQAQGRVADAADAYAVAVALRPDLAGAVPDDLRHEVATAIPAAIAIVGPIERSVPEEARWNMSLAMDVPPADAPAAWPAALLVESGDPRARAAVAALVEAQPTDVKARGLALAAAHVACNPSEVSRETAALRLADREPKGIAHGIVEPRPGFYGYPELGDYQPLTGRSVPLTPPWPLGLIEVPPCDE